MCARRKRTGSMGHTTLGIVLTERLERGRGEKVGGGHPGDDGAGVEGGRDGREGRRDDGRV